MQGYYVLDHSYIIEDIFTDYSDTFASFPSLHHFFTIAKQLKNKYNGY